MLLFPLNNFNWGKKDWRTNQIERITVRITLIYLAFYRSLWTILKKHLLTPSCFFWQLLKEAVSMSTAHASASCKDFSSPTTHHRTWWLFCLVFNTMAYPLWWENLSSQLSTIHFAKPVVISKLVSFGTELCSLARDSLEASFDTGNRASRMTSFAL